MRNKKVFHYDWSDENQWPAFFACGIASEVSSHNNDDDFWFTMLPSPKLDPDCLYPPPARGRFLANMRLCKNCEKSRIFRDHQAEYEIGYDCNTDKFLDNKGRT